MDGHFVTGEIVVGEETGALVDCEFLHQRRANAHGHRADHLAASRLGVEDAPCAHTASMRNWTTPECTQIAQQVVMPALQARGKLRTPAPLQQLCLAHPGFEGISGMGAW